MESRSPRRCHTCDIAGEIPLIVCDQCQDFYCTACIANQQDPHDETLQKLVHYHMYPAHLPSQHPPQPPAPIAYPPVCRQQLGGGGGLGRRSGETKEHTQHSFLLPDIQPGSSLGTSPSLLPLVYLSCLVPSAIKNPYLRLTSTNLDKAPRPPAVSKRRSDARPAVPPRPCFPSLGTWFAPGVNKEEANAILRHAPAGYYLVRPNSSSRGTFVLSIALRGATAHVHIRTVRLQENQRNHHLFAIASGLAFDDLPSLLRYFQFTSLQGIDSKLPDLRLTRACGTDPFQVDRLEVYVTLDPLSSKGLASRLRSISRDNVQGAPITTPAHPNSEESRGAGGYDARANEAVATTAADVNNPPKALAVMSDFVGDVDEEGDNTDLLAAAFDTTLMPAAPAANALF